jgi:hypothetical protein
MSDARQSLRRSERPAGLHDEAENGKPVEKKPSRASPRKIIFQAGRRRNLRRPRRKPRIHRTGRNQQFNAKATAETFIMRERFSGKRNTPPSFALQPPEKR